MIWKVQWKKFLNFLSFIIVLNAIRLWRFLEASRTCSVAILLRCKSSSHSSKSIKCLTIKLSTCVKIQRVFSLVKFKISKVSSISSVFVWACKQKIYCQFWRISLNYLCKTVGICLRKSTIWLWRIHLVWVRPIWGICSRDILTCGWPAMLAWKPNAFIWNAIWTGIWVKSPPSLCFCTSIIPLSCGLAVNCSKSKDRDSSIWMKFSLVLMTNSAKSLALIVISSLRSRRNAKPKLKSINCGSMSPESDKLFYSCQFRPYLKK